MADAWAKWASDAATHNKAVSDAQRQLGTNSGVAELSMARSAVAADVTSLDGEMAAKDVVINATVRQPDGATTTKTLKAVVSRATMKDASGQDDRRPLGHHRASGRREATRVLVGVTVDRAHALRCGLLGDGVGGGLLECAAASRRRPGRAPAGRRPGRGDGVALRVHLARRVRRQPWSGCGSSTRPSGSGLRHRGARRARRQAPDELRRLLKTGTPYLWRVARVDENGQEVDQSELTAFSIR